MKYLICSLWCQMYLGNNHKPIQFYEDNPLSDEGMVAFMDDGKLFTEQEAAALVMKYNETAAMEPYWAMVPYQA